MSVKNLDLAGQFLQFLRQKQKAKGAGGGFPVSGPKLEVTDPLGTPAPRYNLARKKPRDAFDSLMGTGMPAGGVGGLGGASQGSPGAFGDPFGEDDGVF